MSSSSFGALRSLCQQPASRLAFLQIVELLVDAQRQGEAALEPELLPYAVAHVSSWPTSLCEVGGTFARDLVRQNALAGRLVKSLDLSRFDLGGDRIIALLEATNLATITKLDLSDTHIGLAEVSTLCEHPNVHKRQVLTQLEELVMSNNHELDTVCFRLVMHASWMAHVHTIWWCRSTVSKGRDYRDAILGGIDPLPLRTLHLTHSSISAPHAKQLCHSPAFEHLEHLSVSSLSHTEWLAELDRSATMANLKSLNLRPCMDSQYATFLETSLAARIEHLEVQLDNVSHSLYATTRAQLPSLRSLHARAHAHPDEYHADPTRTGDLTSGLEALRVTGWRYSEEALARWLAPGELAPELRVLHVREAPLGGQLASALAVHASEHQVLEELVLHDCKLEGDFMRTFAELDPVTSLRRVDLGGNAIGDEAIARWLRVHGLEGIERLDLSATELGPESLEALSCAPCLHTLTHLNLSFNALPDEPLHALLSSPNLRRLTHLNLSYTEFDDAQLVELNQCVFARSLRELALAGNTVSDRGLQRFLRRAEFDALESLDLHHNALSPRGLTTLSRAYKMSRLRELRVALKFGAREAEIVPGQHIDMNDVYTALLSSETLPHLRELDYDAWHRRTALAETFRRWRAL